jgi:hypothetical protein
MDNHRSPPHPAAPGRPETIGRSELGEVTLCGCCGNVHVALGFTTMRFEPEAFRELAQMVAQAQRRLETPVAAAAGAH